MREHMRQYGRGLQDVFEGKRSVDAAAAAQNLAEVLTLTFQYFTREK